MLSPGEYSAAEKHLGIPDGRHVQLPQAKRRIELAPRGTPAATRTIADVDQLADGRIAVLDFDTRRVALFDASGRFEGFLQPPPGVAPETTLIPRIAALPDGGLILADDEGNRFFFYDRELKPEKVVPMGIDTVSLNGFIRHSSGDLYVVAYAIDRDRILHRFDADGRYAASFVEPLEMAFPERGAYSSGLVAEDPLDGSL